jgi:tetratricopeptide (TPR) repeat protein
MATEGRRVVIGFVERGAAMRRLSWYLAAAGIALVSALLLLPLGARAQSATAVFDRVKDSVFVVKALDAKGAEIALGSAVLLPDGKFATNQHVVKEGASFKVGRGKLFVDATVYAADGDKDIALLEAPDISGKAIQMGSAASLKVGQPVYAVGAPQGLELSISEGIVSQLRGGPPPFIQTTAAISPGSSGGGLFDSEGRLVGLTALYIEGGQNLNFALPVEWIAAVKPGLAAPAKERSQGAWLARAAELEEKKDWPGLRDWSLAWTKSEPRNEDAWYGLGEAYYSLQRYSDAIEAYRQALRINPDDTVAWNNLGAAYDGLQRYSDAIEAYRQALRIKPDYADAWNNLGAAYNGLQRYSDAIEAYRQSLRIEPDDAKAWYNLGYAYGDLQRYSDAIEAYRQALRIKPDDADAWNNLGNAYRRLQRYSDAIEAFRQALRIKPDYAEAWYNLGNVYGSLQRYSDAIEAFREALRIKPDDAKAWYNVGITYYASGNKSAALDVVKTLRRLDPAKADQLFNLIVPR